MQPTYPNLDAIRNNHQITNNNDVYRNSTNTYPMKGTNRVDKTPNEDTVEIGNKPKMSKTKKILLGIGATAIAIVGGVLGHKAIKTHQINKALKALDTKFTDLESKLPEVQKTFKEVFLRENLTEKETLEMLNRYKEIEKIRITGGKEEYAKALFKEAKNNYGLGKTSLEIEYIDCNIGGGFNPSFSEVAISSSANPVERLMNVIHHELRHAKQAYYGINAEPEKFVQALKDSKKGTVFEKYIPEAEDILKTFNMTKPDKTIVADKYKNYVNKIIEGLRKFTSDIGDFGPEYRNNFLEVDARSAGESIANLFGLIAR